jgi:hypothetical protein
MFGITIKPLLATLGVVAGLLVAAAPASAADVPAEKVKAVVVLIGANDYGWTDGDGQPNRDGLVAGRMHLEDVSLGIKGEATQASLGRENSIECLVRAEASDERPAQSPKPAPPGITFCHEGFEIQ